MVWLIGQGAYWDIVVLVSISKGSKPEPYPKKTVSGPAHNTISFA